MEEAFKTVETILKAEERYLFTSNGTYHSERTSLIQKVVERLQPGAQPVAQV